MNLIYTILKYINDIRAVKNGRVAKRIGWRLSGKTANKFFGKLFR